jgi:ADP-heptose:LPS heptosyltransferase
LEGLERSVRDFVFVDADEEKLRAIRQRGHVHADLLVLNARVGLLAALIAASDLYIGYDSAGQHIAAAAGTGCIDIFAGYSGQRMIERWRPTGSGKATLVDAGDGRSVAEITQEVKAVAKALPRLHVRNV